MSIRVVRDSLDIEFDAFGEAKDPLVLLVAGAGAPAAFWPEMFCRELAAQRRYVVRYSHRDTGQSTHFDTAYSIDELLLDMFAFLESLEHTQVHLAGHSMGGYLAQMATCRRPEQFASATSVSAGSTVTTEAADALNLSRVSDKTWALLMQNQPTGKLDEDLPGWLRSWRLLNGKRPFDERLAERYTRALYEDDPRNAQVAVNHIHAMTTVPDSLVDDITQVTCPFLILHGTEDALVPVDHGELTARRLPNSQIYLMKGAGHMFFSDDTWREIGRVLAAHTDRV